AVCCFMYSARETLAAGIEDCWIEGIHNKRRNLCRSCDRPAVNWRPQVTAVGSLVHSATGPHINDGGIGRVDYQFIDIRICFNNAILYLEPCITSVSTLGHRLNAARI